ncbi:MAG: hypothetical protein B7X58_06175 [Marinobacter sp. 34-60-7]|nr:MAG: hypothetical protein B7X58_06175 [Marinobacter sp. 34-60-7]
MVGTSLLLSGALLAAGYQVSFENRALFRRLNALRIAALSERQKARMDMLEVRNRAKLLEDTVSGGTSAVEKVHKTIANTTFGLIDLFSRDDEFRSQARRVQQRHQQTSTEVYRAVRTTNRALHIIADTLFIGSSEKRMVSRTKSSSKKSP